MRRRLQRHHVAHAFAFALLVLAVCAATMVMYWPLIQAYTGRTEHMIVHADQGITVKEDASVTRPVSTSLVTFVPHKISTVRAIYLTMYTAATPSKLNALLAYAARNNINAFVIDVKDGSGKLFFPLAPYDVTHDPDIAANSYLVAHGSSTIAMLRNKGIYLIARIVSFPDNEYARAHPGEALHYANNDTLWHDTKQLNWMDPAGTAYWHYLAHLGAAAVNAGFDEVNFDYMRFPSDGSLSSIAYPFWRSSTPKEDVIASFASFLYSYFTPKGITFSGDIFGQVLVNRDDMGIGQNLEKVLPHFDVLAPMTYPSHYVNGFDGYANPAEHPYEIISYNLEEAQKRIDVLPATSTKATFRPWLQVFNIGAVYDGAMVEKQIKALTDHGVEGGYMLWSPSNTYPELPKNLAVGNGG
ncbi:MAG: hypothetical protein KGI50_02530 [Patescibacteria group bacterium]|nr:hypothetical protein [Patescibacteria group bacterium]MDE2437778.1 hypothetical protein [Patescibacteria group bacterium]